MNILLIAPRMSLRPMDSELKRCMAPPVSLMTLAALTPEEHRVRIVDLNLRAGESQLEELDSPIGLVGITVNVDTAMSAYDLADRYRAHGIPVILGGIHASACPEEGLAHADAVCIGEAEPIWGRILADASKGVLHGRYQAAEPADPATIPAPDRSPVARSQYLYDNVVCASRGCPFTCEFCYNSCAYAHRSHRPRPVASVIAEIQALQTRQVMFIDDNLAGDIPWLWELVEAMAPLGLTWHAAVSTNIGQHPGLLDAMAASGCRSLFVGFESINPASVAEAAKRQNRTESYASLIGALHSRGIMLNASMVFGFDNDKPEVFEETLAWLVKNRVETLTSHILTPYPGTQFHARMVEEDRIHDTDGSHYNTAHVVFQPKGMGERELGEGYRQLYKAFYSWPSILRRLPREKANWMPYLLFNLGYRKYGKLTSLVAQFGLMHRIGALARRLAYGIG